MSEVIAKRLGTEDLEECLRKVGSGTTTEETEVALRGHIAALDADLVRAGNERDAAQLQSKYAWERHAEKDRAYGEALKERDEWKGKALACTDERDEAVALAERRRQDRADALRVTTTEGLSASEWVARAGKAERERDAALVHVSRLEEVVRLANAEFARLRPSGQVAEDVARLDRALNAFSLGTFQDGLRAALSRLAAKAQGYEAAVEAQEQMRVAFKQELDAAQAEARKAGEEWGKMKAEREAAVADNAELLDVGDRIHSLASHDEACKMLVGDDYAMCNCAMGDWQQVQRDAASGRHPGAALLEQHRKALVHARNEGLEKARLMLSAKRAVAVEFGARHSAETLAHAEDAVAAMMEPEQ